MHGPTTTVLAVTQGAPRMSFFCPRVDRVGLRSTDSANAHCALHLKCTSILGTEHSVQVKSLSTECTEHSVLRESLGT